MNPQYTVTESAFPGPQNMSTTYSVASRKVHHHCLQAGEAVSDARSSLIGTHLDIVTEASPECSSRMGSIFIDMATRGNAECHYLPFGRLPC